MAAACFARWCATIGAAPRVQADMAARPPADAIVTLRSMERRWRHLLAPDGPDDQRRHDAARTITSDGHSPLDHLAAATRTFIFHGRALEQTLIDDEPLLHPGVADPAEREWPPAEGTVAEQLAELAWASDHLATRATHVEADAWRRIGRVAGHPSVTPSALALLWQAVDAGVDHLRAAERGLAEALPPR